MSGAPTKAHLPPKLGSTGAAYVRALLEEGTEDFLEVAGVVKVPYDNCGYVALFDAETIGIRGLWAEGRDL